MYRLLFSRQVPCASFTLARSQITLDIKTSVQLVSKLTHVINRKRGMRETVGTSVYFSSRFFSARRWL